MRSSASHRWNAVPLVPVALLRVALRLSVAAPASEGPLGDTGLATLIVPPAAAFISLVDALVALLLSARRASHCSRHP